MVFLDRLFPWSGASNEEAVDDVAPPPVWDEAVAVAPASSSSCEDPVAYGRLRRYGDGEAAEILRDTATDLREILGEEAYEELEATAKNDHGFGEEYLSAVLRRYRSRLQEAVEVAVLGAQGAGKSSLINALRDLPHDDDRAAPVGVVETTLEAARYSHRQVDVDTGGVVYVDNPGRDSSALAAADVVLIVTCTRFTPFDRELASRCMELRKPFLFVRTKVDLDVMNERQSKPKLWRSGELTEQRVIARIRSEVRDSLRATCPGFSGSFREFLVNSQTSCMSPYDLLDLRTCLAHCLPHAKRLEFLRLAPMLSCEMIELKRKKLQEDLRLWTNLSALVFGAQPIPFVGGAVNWGWLEYWKQQLSEEYGCDDTTLHRLFDRLVVLGLDAEQVCQVKAAVACSVLNDCAEVACMSGGLMCSKAKVMFPGVGIIAGGIAGVSLMRWALKTMINRLAQFTLQVHRLVVDALKISELGFEVWDVDSESNNCFDNKAITLDGATTLGGNVEEVHPQSVPRRRLTLTPDGGVELSTEGRPLHLSFEVASPSDVGSSVPPGRGRLALFRDRSLALCVVVLGEERRLCVCLCSPTGGGADACRLGNWRRRPMMPANLDGPWKWAFDCDGLFIVRGENGGLRLEALDESFLHEATRAHFALENPAIVRPGRIGDVDDDCPSPTPRAG